MSELYHYGIKGMRWGVKRKKVSNENQKSGYSETKDKLDKSLENRRKSRGDYLKYANKIYESNKAAIDRQLMRDIEWLRYDDRTKSQRNIVDYMYNEIDDFDKDYNTKAKINNILRQYDKTKKIDLKYKPYTDNCKYVDIMENIYDREKYVGKGKSFIDKFLNKKHF